MKVPPIANAISVEVSELDLIETDNGQLVTVVTDKGTFWVIRLEASAFHGQTHGAERIAISGTDFTSGDPMRTKCTRKLCAGKEFDVIVNGQQTTTTIEHILLPVISKG